MNHKTSGAENYMKKITIAIDGYSSTGKSTVARQLADSLEYVYVDSGAMYRAVALFALQKGIISENYFDRDKLIKSLPLINLEFKKVSNNKKAHIHLNGEDVENEIRNLKVSAVVSPIATVSEVRAKLVILQKEMGKNKGVVMDGRDIGTVVFPNAELKLFMTSTPQKRAERRYKELQQLGEDIDFDDVLHNIEERDLIDTTRKDSPLRKAEDAIEIDNSEMNLEDQFQLALQLAQDRIAGRI